MINKILIILVVGISLLNANSNKIDKNMLVNLEMICTLSKGQQFTKVFKQGDVTKEQNSIKINYTIDLTKLRNQKAKDMFLFSITDKKYHKRTFSILKRYHKLRSCLNPIFLKIKDDTSYMEYNYQDKNTNIANYKIYRSDCKKNQKEILNKNLIKNILKDSTKRREIDNNYLLLSDDIVKNSPSNFEIYDFDNLNIYSNFAKSIYKNDKQKKSLLKSELIKIAKSRNFRDSMFMIEEDVYIFTRYPYLNILHIAVGFDKESLKILNKINKKVE